MSEDLNTQSAPYPDELADLVANLRYRPGWSFYLVNKDRGQGSVGLTLKVLSRGYDSYHPDRGENYGVWHYMPVPPAAFSRRAWQRWLLDQLLLIERHETCEFFQVGEDRPFAPVHAPGADPYAITELATDVERRTSFRGDVKTETVTG